MGAYISKFENTWAVIWTDEKGNVHIDEYYSEEKAQARLATFK